MNLPPVSVVLTAAGCPGAATLIRMLKANGEREVSLVGVDVRADAVGRFLCDAFDHRAARRSDEYVPALAARGGARAAGRAVRAIVRRGGRGGARARPLHSLGRDVLVAAPDAVALSRRQGAPCTRPGGDIPRAPAARARAAHLGGVRGRRPPPGLPRCARVLQAAVAKGSRGFHVLRPDADAAHQLLFERGSNLPLTLDAFVATVRHLDPFPRLLLMEFVGGPEHTVDALVRHGELVLHQTKTREAIETGLAMSFKTLARPELVEVAREICRRLRLDWFVNIQFKGDKLLEVNPRVSTFVYQQDFILPYLGIKYALGELDAAAVAAAQARVRPSRRTVRYYDQMFWDV